MAAGLRAILFCDAKVYYACASSASAFHNRSVGSAWLMV
jgi:hypothetical protein